VALYILLYSSLCILYVKDVRLKFRVENVQKLNCDTTGERHLSCRNTLDF